jgi:hypothetical protein
LCDFLYTAELVPANPMQFVGRPKAAKTLPRSLPQPAVGALLAAVDRDHEPQGRTDWSESLWARRPRRLAARPAPRLLVSRLACRAHRRTAEVRHL